MLTLTKVTKQFGSQIAVDKLDLNIPQGLVFGLLGPNGSGKSTLLRMIMGLLKPTSGNILIFNNNSPGDFEVKHLLGYMPQQLAVYPGLSVRENVLFYGRLYGIPETELETRLLDILEMVELSSCLDNLAADLSGGMLRRLMLATTLIHQPSLVILDEPTAGVDPSLRLRFWEWFEELAHGGTSILITTHHISEASRCNKVAFLRQGKLLEHDTPEKLMQRYDSANLEEAFVQATQANFGEMK
ncbi:MAG: ABC transporter ATP-binding protein [SAR324 cluster bacterium]|nr:ABC transporter ATP-binding protein [SAR324 cluster bacterium]MBL7034827.1 ABC transporter ATP-binding protein [SAR324 cluster bacterium]